MLRFKKIFDQRKTAYFDFIIVLIITIPAFFSLFNNFYFTMHDDQHLARLFLLDQGLKQGYLYPRWVDILGFNFGYPLFNFYPPIAYYVAEIFHLFGTSFIWSLKLTFILGFLLASWGIFLYAKKLLGRSVGFIAAVFYTYFFYHAVLIYVRGALAEFISLAILPFVFLTFENLKRKKNLKNSLFFGFTIAVLILSHSLIAFPSTIFLFLFFLFYLALQSFERLKLFIYSMFSGFFGLMLSAFYWIPCIFEKKFTLTDKILTRELANYKIHFICLKQFLYSNWGYGGSITGCNDGLTFQIGKAHILIIAISLISFIVYLFSKEKSKEKILYFLFFLFLTLLSLFMTTSYSLFIWDNIKPLSYIQFPWRFLTFAGFFISVSASYGVFFLWKIIKNKTLKWTFFIFITIYLILTIVIYRKYFYPQHYIKYNDTDVTSFREIAWRVSRTSFEFIPKDIKTTKSQLKTTIPDIKPSDIDHKSYTIINGKGIVRVIQNKFKYKTFLVNTENSIDFRLNTFNFPGWTAYLNDKKIKINYNNKLQLITVKIPKGEYVLEFIFEETPLRKIADTISIISLILFILGIYFVNSKR